MNDEQKASYVFTQAVCALLEMEGMKAENKQRELRGESLAYDHKAFCDLILQYGIGHNSVITIFNKW